jgi:glutathione synthase/RimK-type ligase-like ATP-grasp enzyme
MDFGKMLRAVRETAKENKKLSLVIFFDMVFCAMCYGAGYLDYRTFEFAKMPRKRRKTFVTRGINNEFIRKLNSRQDYDKFEDKVKFNSLFKDYVKRDWLFLKDISPDEFAEFVKNKSSIMAKPIDALCGIGVEKLDVTQKSPQYEALLENGLLLVEDYIVQHPEIARIYPDSVNTVRIVTVAASDEVHVMFRALRMGSGGSVVDNFHFGGMVAILNEQGEIITDAINEKHEVYAAHPSSGVVFKGTKIPLFEQAETMVKEAARLVPGIRYVGWDVAISADGAQLIEANHNPAYDFYQTRTYMAEHENGLLPLFKSVISI